MNQKAITGFFKRKSSNSTQKCAPPTIEAAAISISKKARIDASASTALPPSSSCPELTCYCSRLPVLDPLMCPEWFDALRPQFDMPYFAKLSKFVLQERAKHTVYPPAHHTFSWARLPLSKIRVVIIGQDPYHSPGQAHGLCFSVLPGVRAPPSLLNIFQELERDEGVPGFQRPSHGCLAGWGRQGVLLLNACLTVRAGQANSHKDQGWEKLTDAVIRQVSLRNTGVVFLLWGAYAQKKCALLNKSRHHILTAVHPSPLSAHRGFIGCGHFSRCNQLLEKDGKKPIDWNKLDVVDV